VDEIESELQQRPVREVSSLEIGELVLQQLRLLSEVAYVRFASVYRQFQSIRDFVDTLDDLLVWTKQVKRKPKQLILVIQNSLQHMSSRTLALGYDGSERSGVCASSR